MKSLPQFLTGASITNLIGLLIRNDVERKFSPRAIALIMCSALLTPFYFLESLYVRIVPHPPMHPEPVFIIGHWRSGTTYLHYLMARDKQFGYCSNTDAFIPGALFVGRWLSRQIIAWRLPPTRPVDNVKLSADSPQEEEFAIMLLSKYSSYHAFVFPSMVRNFFTNYTLLSTDDVSTINEWKEVYFRFVRKLSIRNGNKRLLLKNPTNTTRIKHLVSMFPKAKFIYLHRDPAEVRSSTVRLLNSLIQANSLESFNHIDMDEEAAYLHESVTKEYEQQRNFPESQNLVEVRYEDLLADPLAVVKRIYSELNLPGFDSSVAAFLEFIGQQKTYQPHNYEFNQKQS
ncbi:MAG TPA: sulfotransferase [Chryseolinea sp.]|nr:sulfotransferase [Chryseolinea sp.]